MEELLIGITCENCGNENFFELSSLPGGSEYCEYCEYCGCSKPLEQPVISENLIILQQPAISENLITDPVIWEILQPPKH